GHSGSRRLCLGGSAGRRRAGLELINSHGRAIRAETVPARLKRPQPDELVLAIVPGSAGLSPHRYRWRILHARGRCPHVGRCEEALPDSGERLFRLRPVRPVGCTGGTGGLDTNGPRDRDVVALTFDDGPSEYTPGFLSVLRRKHVHATFFEI